MEAISIVTVFIEYKLDEQKRQDFLAQIGGMDKQIAKRGGTEYRLLEGMDQPGLIVETFEVESVEAYQQIKAWRLADQSFCECIRGGAEKLHIWAFTALAAH